MRKISGLLLGGLLLLIAPSSISAAAEDDDVARVHFLAGQAYYDQASYEDALREFQEAYRAAKRPALLYNIGLCHERLGRFAQAVQALEQYLADSPGARDRSSVEARIAKLKQAVPPPPAPPPPPASPTASPTAATAPPPPPTAPPPHRRRVATWAIGGLGLALLAGAAVSGAIAQDRMDTLSSHCPVPASCAYAGLRADRDSGKQAQLATDVLWPIGAAAVLTGIVLFFVEGRASKPARAWLAPTVESGSAALQLVGGF